MTHAHEDDLIAHALGEAEPGTEAATAAHLESCAECRAALAEIRATLDAAAAMPVPERGDDYGPRVWDSIEPRLGSSGGAPGTWHDARSTARGTVHRARGTARWLAVAAALLLAAGAYWLGRQSVSAPVQQATVAPTPAAPAASTIRERVMLAALGEHLDRTERTLVELVNTEPGARVDISAEQQWARDLLEANRLYRQAASGAASPALAQVLEDLEPVLLEVANSPSRITSEEFEALRARIESRSLLFKVRVSGADVRARERALTPRRAQGVPSA